MRRSESINLKVGDIDSKRMLIKIREAKGNKDRYVQLSANILPLLREYYREEKPVNWLFEGSKGRRYSEMSIYNVIKKVALDVGIKKRVYPHILRIVLPRITLNRDLTYGISRNGWGTKV